MADDKPVSMSAVVERLHRITAGDPFPEDAEKLTPKQVKEAQQALDDAAFARSENASSRKAEAKRYAAIKQVITGAVQLRHGQAYTAADRAQLVAGIEKQLGGEVSKAVHTRLGTMVNVAADAIESGDAKTGWKAAADTAVEIANDASKITPLDVGRRSSVDDDEMDPSKLAAAIGRM